MWRRRDDGCCVLNGKACATQIDFDGVEAGVFRPLRRIKRESTADAEYVDSGREEEDEDNEDKGDKEEEDNNAARQTARELAEHEADREAVR